MGFGGYLTEVGYDIKNEETDDVNGKYGIEKAGHCSIERMLH